VVDFHGDMIQAPDLGQQLAVVAYRPGRVGHQAHHPAGAALGMALGFAAEVVGVLPIAKVMDGHGLHRKRGI
jgi:hypothetical protein